MVILKSDDKFVSNYCIRDVFCVFTNNVFDEVIGGILNVRFVLNLKSKCISICSQDVSYGFEYLV